MRIEGHIISAEDRGDKLQIMGQGKKAEAEQKWQEALAIDPLHPETTYNWGLTQWRSLRCTDRS